MEHLLKDNILSSWKITAGNFGVTVTIRFKAERINESDMENTLPISQSFRRKSPSQISRAQTRAKMWLEKRRRHGNIDTRENEKPQNQNDDVDGNVDIQEFTTHRTAILTTNTEPDVKQAIDGEISVEKNWTD